MVFMIFNYALNVDVGDAFIRESEIFSQGVEFNRMEITAKS